MVKGQRALLPPEDEERLRQLAATGGEAARQRARAVLAWHEGATANEAAGRTKLSVNQVQYLWRIYRRKGLDLFLIENDTPVEEAAATHEEMPTAVAVAEAPAPVGTTLEALCAEYKVDMAHARHVAGLAVQIFDQTMNVHRLPQNVRALLEAAAFVHNVAYGIDQPNHHLRGRDILMATPIRGFTDDERRILACTTSFHRKKVRPEAEPVYTELPAELRRDALALSAILRVADGLDNSQTQSTTIGEIQAGSEVVIVVEGPHAGPDSEQAQKKADLWNDVFPSRVRVTRPIQEVEQAAPILRTVMPLHSTMSVTHAGRSFALHTLERIESLLPSLSRGETDYLPQLTREASRLQEAVGLADLKELRKEARWFATAVEELRVLAATAERTGALVEELGESGALAERTRGWQAEASAAISALDVKRFRKMAGDLRTALADVAANEKAQVAYHIGSILWDQLSDLRTVMEHGSNVYEALEAVRRLQDHLAAFRQLLGPEVGQVLDMLAPLENYLAAIATTQAILTRIEIRPAKRGRKPATPPPPDPALEPVRQAQGSILEMLADDLPSVWSSVNSAIFRRAFALAIAAP